MQSPPALSVTRAWRRTLCFAVALACGACSRTAITVRPIPNGAAPGSAEPSIEVGADGRAYLSWIEPTDGGDPALRLSAWDGAAWSAPRTVASGADWFVNWADFPSVTALEDGTLVAHWLRRTAGAPYAYGVEIALSADGGGTWSAPLVPHDDSPTEHGFVSKVPLEGGVAVMWLDGRDTAGGHHEPAGAMALRAAFLSRTGAVEREQRIDDRVCDCCQTAAVLAGDGTLVVAYRDRSADEVRDISVVRFDGRAWTAPRTVHDDGWTIPGCPVNGPALAAHGRDVAVVWFTSPGDPPEPRVLLAFSGDAGTSFGGPIRVDLGRPLGRVDVALTESGDAVVTWLETDGDAARIVARRVGRDGAADEPALVGATSSARASGFPRTALLGTDLLVAWTETGTYSGVRTARAEIGR